MILHPVKDGMTAFDAFNARLNAPTGALSWGRGVYVISIVVPDSITVSDGDMA